MKYTCQKCHRNFVSERGLKTHLRSCNKKPSKNKSASFLKDWNYILLGVFTILLLVNFIVMSLFTFSLNNKLDDAIALTKPISGELTMILSGDCPDCQSLDALRESISKQNVKIKSDNTLSSDSKEAINLITQLSIGRLPALVFRSDDEIILPDKHPLRKNSRIFSDNTLVWESENPPYFDLENNTTVGLVDIIYLTDRSCAECYDVNVQKPILSRFGVRFAKEKTIDIADEAGKSLLSDYAITKVPTVILSAEARRYQQLVAVWKQVGTVEADGSFVFRNLQALQAKYHDLDSDSIKSSMK